MLTVRNVGRNRQCFYSKQTIIKLNKKLRNVKKIIEFNAKCSNPAEEFCLVCETVRTKSCAQVNKKFTLICFIFYF